MADADEIKRKMLEQMQTQYAQEQQFQAEKELIENQKKALLRTILGPEARARLERIRLAKPEEAGYIEMQLIRLYQAGKITQQIHDSAFKKILRTLIPGKRDIRIRRV